MDVGASIVISGFKVKGNVQSEGTPVKGVNFVLFSVLFNKEDIHNCEKAPLSGFASPDGTQPLCYVTSKEDGSFLFPSLPVGEFYVIPFYKGEHIRFDVVPAKLEFRVHHAPVTLEPVFQVAGFSVSGQVLNSEKGQGVSGAEITVNGKQVTKTSNDGTYHLENMKTGEYKISVTKENIYFEDLDVKITPNTPQLPVIIATGFSLCGQIIIDKLPDSLSRSPMKRRVIIYPEGKNSEAISIATETDGKFCTKVGKGKFIVKVHLTDEETKAGLLISPNEKVVTLVNTPILDVTFSQFRASISGKVTCLEKCGAIEVLLDPLGRGEKEKKTITESGKGGNFIFDKVMPGKYKVTLLHDSWCWKDKTLDVEVVDTDISGIEFVQTGYILKCSISHEVKLHFAHEKKEGNVGSFNLNKGTNRFCLAQPGVYRLTMDSCHKFEKDVYTYDTSNPELLTLTAVKHLVEGQIETEQRVDDIVVTIISQTDKEPVTLGPLKSVTPESKPSKDSIDKQQDTGPFVYKFSHWARSGEKLEVSVKSKELLFSPPKTDITVQGDTCPGEIVKIIGKRGLFIIGRMKPALAGVNISVVTIDRSLMDPLYVETGCYWGFQGWSITWGKTV
ncbi:hypothetical protein KUTeg_022806 [Tegillarca granosa]|uniref:Nodal modulator 1 n=1 Tax=Tegillarca granosa TaxID=220873 RepID=A0ABQ9DZU5_TEGGR|nr:hypothetical protein KUTeg_022806 [Tegillarca granosa]